MRSPRPRRPRAWARQRTEPVVDPPQPLRGARASRRQGGARPQPGSAIRACRREGPGRRSRRRPPLRGAREARHRRAPRCQVVRPQSGFAAHHPPRGRPRGAHSGWPAVGRREDTADRSAPSVFPQADEEGSMHRRDVGWDNSLRRALAAAGLVEGYEHGCRAHRCGWRGRSTQRERPALCPQCGRPSTWSKPIPRHLTFKDLRHTTATLLLKAGAPLATVQRLLRHSDPKLTAMIYGHLETDDLRRGLERLKLTGGPVSCRQPQPPSPDLPVNGDSIGRTAPELRNGATTEKKRPRSRRKPPGTPGSYDGRGDWI